MKTMIGHFSRMIAQGDIEIYNEISLQHEYGIFMRQKQRETKVQFERNVSYFFNKTEHFLKKEIDLVVFSHNKQTLHCAIEFKYPTNGQYPEQMYKFCKDIAFLEQLKEAKGGFLNAYFIAFADDRLFYAGKSDGIYGYFRKGVALTGVVQKPTGKQNKSVTINGNYHLVWEPVKDSMKYLLVEI